MKLTNKLILLIIFSSITIFSYCQLSIEIFNEKAGKLENETNDIANKESIERLKISGELDGSDFFYIRQFKNIKEIDLSSASIADYPVIRDAHKANELPSYAFEFLKYLEIINLPPNIIAIKNGAFKGCSSLKKVLLPKDISYLGEYIFSYCDSLEKLDISENIKHLSARTFENFKGKIYIDEKNQYFCKIDEVIFNKNKTRLIFCTPAKKGNYFTPETITEIGEYAFGSCNNINNIKFPPSLTYVGDYAFTECNALSKIDLPESVDFIGKGAFSFCRKLNEVSIPSQLTTIEDYLFQGCIKLKNIVLPDSINKIGNYAFYYCEELSSLTIPSTIKEIGIKAFSDSKKLSKIYCNSTEPELIKLGDNVFKEINKTYCQLYIPRGTLLKYRQIKQWDEFEKIIEN